MEKSVRGVFQDYRRLMKTYNENFNQNIRKIVGNQCCFLPDLNNCITSQLHQLHIRVTEENQ